MTVLIAALAAGAAWAPAPAGAQEPPRAVIVAFHPGGGAPGSPTVFARIAVRPDLALGLTNSTQGAYSVRQALLDMTAGTRTSRATYRPDDLPAVEIVRERVAGWDGVVRRAASAPAPITPGLLADVAGGGAFVGEELAVEALLAADTRGGIEETSLGAPSTIADRAILAAARHPFVVALLPRGRAGDRALDELRLRRADSQLLIVMARPPRSEFPQLIPTGAAGLGDGLITSRTTRRRGFVAAIDLAPTVFDWLGRTVPNAATVRGRAITADGGRDVAYVRRMERRLRVVFPRRYPAIYRVLGAIALAVLVLVAAGRRREAARIGGLALMWVPAVALIGAALAPSRAHELVLMAVAPIVLAIATDRLVRWPRGPAVPCLVGVVGYAIDLAGNSHLTVRSLFGPNPRFGSRFFGVGNELEALLPVLLLVGIAALGIRHRRALAFGLGMLALGVVMGAGRLGADVGGVITAGAGGAVAVLVARGTRPSRALIALAVATPALALAALAAIDLLTGGDAHFTRTVLGEDLDDFGDTVRRRYELAWNALRRGLMPLSTLLAIGLVAYAWRNRDRLYAPVRGDRGWAAALLGGLAGGVLGTLTNDSGPILLVLGVIVLAAATAYIRGEPVTETPQGRTL